MAELSRESGVYANQICARKRQWLGCASRLFTMAAERSRDSELEDRELLANIEVVSIERPTPGVKDLSIRERRSLIHKELGVSVTRQYELL